MDKFIEYDIHNGITQLKCAVMNILHALDSMELDSYTFDLYISPNLIVDCMIELGWKRDGEILYSPSKRDFVFDETTLKLCDE